MARTTRLAEFVEDGLPDYGSAALLGTRNIRGINKGYFQWIRDESQHSPALRMIREHTEHNLPKPTPDEYFDSLAYRWNPPFPTIRQMILYAAFQERNTFLNYQRLADAADREGAHTVAAVFRLVGQDEAFHNGGFVGNAKIYYEFDPEGTKQDALFVAANFLMPRQNLYPNPMQALRDAQRLGMYDREIVSEGTIYHVLKSFGFISEEKAQLAAKNYWEKPGVVELPILQGS